MGHLCRTLDIIDQLKLEKPVAIFTESILEYKDLNKMLGPRLKDIHLIQPSKIVFDDREALGRWIEKELIALSCEELYIDVFPVGLYGELQFLDFEPKKKHLVSRALKWNEYRDTRMIPLGINDELIYFDTVFTLESLDPEYISWLSQRSQAVHALKLESTSIASIPDHIDLPLKYRLVIHAGSDDEIEQLYLMTEKYASTEGGDYPIIIVTPIRPAYLSSKVRHLNYFPAKDLIDRAISVTTAGGFNSVRDMEGRDAKHLVMPFPRRFDDQFKRVARLLA